MVRWILTDSGLVAVLAYPRSYEIENSSQRFLCAVYKMLVVAAVINLSCSIFTALCQVSPAEFLHQNSPLSTIHPYTDRFMYRV